MKNARKPPEDQEFELTLLGPGYGESIVMHVGGGEWVVVDSFLDSAGRPAAVRYLEEISVNPAESVVLIVATHWHDDHIRGIARLVTLCSAAGFCCAGALFCEEFLTLAGALERRHFSASGSGMREMHDVFSVFEVTGKRPAHAMANRVVLRTDACTVSSLSSSDAVFQSFLKSVERLIPGRGANKTRIPTLFPNQAAVALRVNAQPVSLLLGADLERSGWVAIFEDKTRPAGRASVFKVPHHGSKDADEPGIWKFLLEPDSYVVLTSWRRGSRVLPTPQGTRRISAATANAYVSAANTQPVRRGLRHAERSVAKTLRESGVQLRSPESQDSSVRLRRRFVSARPWSLELRGDARHLKNFAA